MGEIQKQVVQSVEREYATFHVGEMLCGIDIQEIREINRQVDMTAIPHAPNCVRGVINLRGEVVTVLDLAGILWGRRSEVGTHTRNVIVRSRDESIGLLVERVADIVRIHSDTVEAPPPNVAGADSRYFTGVCAAGEELVVLLDVHAISAVEAANN